MLLVVLGVLLLLLLLLSSWSNMVCMDADTFMLVWLVDFIHCFRVYVRERVRDYLLTNREREWERQQRQRER